MRTPVSVQREIVRLISKTDLSNRAIAERLSMAHSTVGIIRRKFKACRVSFNELIDLDDNVFNTKLNPRTFNKESDRNLPDWHSIQKELQLRDVTLSLLWEEYRSSFKGDPENCVSYSQFCRLFKNWLKTQRIAMRQFHKPGEKMFIDFCGRTIPIIDPQSNQIKSAQIFVAVLGASGFTFAFAVPSQKIKDWIYCHVKAFEFFGGVSQQGVPDNLKSAVLKHTSKELVLNKAYADMADHYGIIINPARSRRPKDKALAESAVKIVQRWVLAPLRHHKFFSVDELNIEIEKRMFTLNNKKSVKYKQSRYERYLDLEKHALQPLPSEIYEVADWKYNVRVPADYHIQYQSHSYSVPYQHINQLVDIRITQNTIEFLLGHKRIASHRLVDQIGQTTLEVHMPKEHLIVSESSPEVLLRWAQDIGLNTFEWVRQNLQQRRDYANGLKSASRLRRWAREEQNHGRLESACGFALSIRAITFQQLQNIVRNNSDQRFAVEATSWVKTHENVRGRDYYSEPRAQEC